MTSQPLLFAYVDETGDRGVSAKSSQFFSMAGVVVAAEDEAQMRATAAKLRGVFGVPPGFPLHWKDHVKIYSRRQLVAQELAALPGVVVNYVIFEKAAIPPGSGLYIDQAVFYNYVAGIMMERLVLTAKFWPGGPRRIAVRFGHVRGFDHEKTKAYLKVKPSKSPSWVPWSLVQGDIKFADTTAYDGLQVADQYAGMLSAAIVADRFGGYEEHHLLRVRHQIRRHQGNCWNYGFKVMAQPGTMSGLPWWPAGGI